ncbi:MAG: YqgE/AlgH family protein, partial [Alphaproteobacteria bacterium]|nr:YqgE/AlgH family protein [Alphaproteobacteria bacterium]
GDLMGKLGIEAKTIVANKSVLFGGPVETEKGFVLHSSDYSSKDATLPVTGTVSLTATRDVLCAISEGSGPTNWLFALGYAGWGAGQLENEMASNGWVHCDPDDRILFGTDLESRWSGALARMGIDLSGFSADAGRA